MTVLLWLALSPATPAAPPTGLAKPLAAFAGDCHRLLRGEEAEDISDRKIVEDAASGYLHVEGSYPTCGCTCSVTVGAYRKKTGGHVFLRRERWSCEQLVGIAASEPLHTVLPKGFGMAMFTDAVPASDEARFYLDAEIPRSGTDTVLVLGLLPFGTKARCPHGLCTSLEPDSTDHIDLTVVQRIARAVKDATVLEAIMAGPEVDAKGSAKEMERVRSMLDEKCPTMERLRDHLLVLRRTYEIHQSLTRTRVTLSWNRALGRFEIKDTPSAPTPRVSFLEFLRDLHFWSAVC